jgi:hypothetical protein
MNARKLILAILTTTLGVIAFANTPVLAAKGYIPAALSSFGSEGSGNGQFSEPSGVAVNDSTELANEQAGDVYVTDKGNSRVEYFNSAGVYAGQFNGAETPATSFSEAEQIAVDNSGKTVVEDPSVSDVYVADKGHGAIDKFSSTGEYKGQLTGTCPSAGTCSAGEVVPFEELRGVAVDPSGNLWVLQGVEHLDEFTDTGAFVRAFTTGVFAGGVPRSGLAVDSSGDLYFIFRSFVKFAFSVAKFDTATGNVVAGSGNEPVPIGAGVTALAINPSTNNLLVDEATAGNIALYGPFAEPYETPIQTFPLAESRGIAINGASGTAYVSQLAANSVAVFDNVPLPAVTTQPATPVTEGTELLHGSVDPEGEELTDCRFEYGTEAGVYPETVPCAQTPAAIGSGTAPVAVSAELSGLELHSTYHFRLDAVSVRGAEVPGNDETFYTVTAPAIEGEFSSDIGSTDATVGAHVNANGSPTTYHVEYGTVSSGAYPFLTSDAGIGPPKSAVGVLVHLGGLQTGTEYHYRFVATNALQTTHGVPATFTTTSSAGPSALTLPDNRAYEMVSPPDNRDLDLPQGAYLAADVPFAYTSSWPFRAAVGGAAVAYQGLPPSSGGNGIEVGLIGNQFLAARTSKGWEASDITPAPVGAKEEAMEEFYEYFSSDLSVGVIHSSVEGAEGATVGQRLTVDASPCDVLYSRASSGGAFGALFTATPTPQPRGCGAEQVFAGASADNSHNLIQTPIALTGQAEADPFTTGEANLYDAVGGQLHSVNVSSDGKAVPNATFGGPLLLGGSTLGITRVPNFSNVISADGSRVFWTSLEPVATEQSFGFKAVPKALYVRENDATTVELDATQGPGPSGGGRFWAASRDGARAFFSDCSRLTEDSTAVLSAPCETATALGSEVKGSDLYESDVATGRLTDLTVDHNPADPLGANVQGVLGASQDGAYIYFVASGVIAPGASHRICKAVGQQISENTKEHEEGLISDEVFVERRVALEAEQGEETEGKIPPRTGCNLYVSHDGVLTFIQTLAPSDDNLTQGGQQEPITGEYGDWAPNMGHRLAQVVANGDLVFDSRNRLTGYDSFIPDTVVGAAHSALEAFVYHASTAQLSCVSCQPSGAPPPVAENGGKEEPLHASLQPTYMQRWITADGSRVFFNTTEPLVPQDTNGQVDVYEWEREGAERASCPQQAPARPNGGCVFLLSGGSSSYLSVFVDADPAGENVFFETRAQLVPSDHNNNLKLYDARVGGGFPESSLACEGTGCQGVPPAAPIFATPSSATFNGVGNFPPPTAAKGKTAAQIRAEKLTRALKACKRDKAKKKRVACEKQARKRYGPAHKAKKAGKARRASDKRRATR